MIEISLLKTFLNRENFEGFRHLLDTKTLAKEVVVFLTDVKVFFELNPDVPDVRLEDFRVFFFNVRNPYLDDNSVEAYQEIFRLIEKSDNTEAIDRLVYNFKQQELYNALTENIRLNKDLDVIEHKIEEFKELVKKEDLSQDFVDMNLEEALVYTDRSNGLRWRCQALQDYFKGGLITGDFGIIAGFVGAGKTSFLASEISYMATQLEEEDYILWLSNEGNWKSVLPRIYCAALNCTPVDLRDNKDKAIKAYSDKMQGNKNKVQILDIQGWTAKDIEKVIKKRPPKLLVIDLVDHINGFDKYINKESSFEKYGKLYQWCREIATQYCPVLGVSQLNGEGEDSMYPKMSQLRGSRVDKQAACTFMLTIGSLTGNNTQRFLGVPKSKVNEIADWQATVSFDALRSRYK